MTTLVAPTYSLTYGELVAVRVKSRNAYGWSLDSQTNTVGATIQTVPTQMGTITYLPLTSSAA